MHAREGMGIWDGVTCSRGGRKRWQRWDGGKLCSEDAIQDLRAWHRGVGEMRCACAEMAQIMALVRTGLGV